MGKAVGWLGHEMRQMLPAFLFFWVLFTIIVLTDALYVKGYSVNEFHFAGAIILGLLVAKAMALANKLPFLDAFPERPLAYNTLWKTGIYTALAVLIYFAERTVRLFLQNEKLVAVDPKLLQPFPWSRFWMVLIWLIVAFLIFVSYTELDRRLGRKLRGIFFSSGAAEDG